MTRPRFYEHGVWVTKAEDVLKISEMDLSHVRNARAMLLRCIAKGKGSSGCGLYTISAARLKVKEFDDCLDEAHQIRHDDHVVYWDDVNMWGD